MTPGRDQTASPSHWNWGDVETKDTVDLEWTDYEKRRYTKYKVQRKLSACTWCTLFLFFDTTYYTSQVVFLAVWWRIITWRCHAARLNRSTTSCEWYGQRRKTRRRNILGSRVTMGHIWTWEVAGFCRWFMMVFWISFMDRMLCQCLGLLCTNWLAVLSISTGFLLECWCYPESLPPKGEMRLMYFMDLYVSFFEWNWKKSPWYHQPRYAIIRDNSNIWLYIDIVHIFDLLTSLDSMSVGQGLKIRYRYPLGSPGPKDHWFWSICFEPCHQI